MHEPDKHGETKAVVNKLEKSKRICCLLIGHNNTKHFYCAQSGANIRVTLWNWSGEDRYPGALPSVLENFRRAFSPSPTAPESPRVECCMHACLNCSTGGSASIIGHRLKMKKSVLIFAFWDTSKKKWLTMHLIFFLSVHLYAIVFWSRCFGESDLTGPRKEAWAQWGFIKPRWEEQPGHCLGVIQWPLNEITFVVTASVTQP